MEVYIVRHGQTVWNAEGRLQGNQDIQLNENGKAAARKLAEQLKDVDFDCVFSSPLVRAYETACIVCGNRDIPIIKDDRIREISFGDLEGVHNSEWQQGPYRFFFTDPGKYIPPKNGESLSEVCERTKEFLEEQVEAKVKEFNRIMIVAHGAANKGMMCHIEGNSVDNYWGDGIQKNCEATKFVYNGKKWERMTC